MNAETAPKGRTAAELLLMAADLIEPEGKWVQGALCGDRTGRPLLGAITGADFCGYCWCASGAIDKAWWNARHAEQERLTSLEAREEAKRILRNHLGRIVVEWNDEPSRTQAEVVSKMREAAEASS